MAMTMNQFEQEISGSNVHTFETIAKQMEVIDPAKLHRGDSVLLGFDTDVLVFEVAGADKSGNLEINLALIDNNNDFNKFSPIYDLEFNTDYSALLMKLCRIQPGRRAQFYLRGSSNELIFTPRVSDCFLLPGRETLDDY